MKMFKLMKYNHCNIVSDVELHADSESGTIFL